jgi:hypothetical protein
LSVGAAEEGGRRLRRDEGAVLAGLLKLVDVDPRGLISVLERGDEPGKAIHHVLQGFGCEGF